MSKFTTLKKYEDIDNRVVYTINNENIEINNITVQPFAGNYYCNVGDTVSLSGEISDLEGTVTEINIPITLKMPMIRHADGKPTQDEIYLNTTISSGVLTVTGEIPWSGDWKIVIERVNQALLRIGAQWKLNHQDITFLA